MRKLKVFKHFVAMNGLFKSILMQTETISLSITTPTSNPCQCCLLLHSWQIAHFQCDADQIKWIEIALEFIQPNNFYLGYNKSFIKEDQDEILILPFIRLE